MKTRAGTPSLELFDSLLEELKSNEFQGKASTCITDRIVASTDNSLYQVVPAMVVRPDSVEDVEKVVGVLNQERFSHLPLTVRAGGTGTNGQSLSEGVVLDLGRHFNRIREINLNENWVEVEAGIILDTLNNQLAEHNVFFAPTTSTANRCSIGGMVGTDAAGKGSRRYGKTSDNVLALDVLLINGERLWLEPKELDRLANKTSDKICRNIHQLCMSKREQIQKAFPVLNRRLSGYDLNTSVRDEDVIDPTRMICGSEGTLAIVLGARLKLTPKPKYKKLVILAYKDFIQAVSSAQTLLPFDPDAIETIDDVIQEKAIKGPLGKLLPESFKQKGKSGSVPICNFVEFSGNEEDAVLSQAKKLIKFAEKDKTILAAHLVSDSTEQAVFWNARKAAVGLLADCPPGPQPAAFVEDCVVPPENLADFLTEFRSLLDSLKMSYGMFGHVDVGCIHVRPAINQNKKDVTKQVRNISDETQKLVRKYGGLLWGEHGKGFRGEYLEETVGTDVYEVMRDIKALFDPQGRLNPGKLASPSPHKKAVTRIDEAPMRSGRNRQVSEQKRMTDYADAFRCNGNAQCLNANYSAPMCPSFKATGDYRFSPKGRSDLLREWMRLQEGNSDKTSAFEKELYPVLDACLSCKACTSSCPVHVDIPEMKSRFLEDYHRSHNRPLRDYAFSMLESFSGVISKFPMISNMAMRNPLSKLVSNALGIVDAPASSVPSIHSRLKKRHAKIWSCGELVDALKTGAITSPPENYRAVSPIVLIDGFNIAYDAQSLEDIYDGLCNLGFYPFFVYVGASGKALHVKGFRSGFRKIAEAHIEDILKVTSLKLPIVVAESSYYATLSKDFSAVGVRNKLPKMKPLHQYLVDNIKHIKKTGFTSKTETAKYFPHCTEKTAMPGIDAAWKEILETTGVKVENVETGCCGMSGAFGHEKKHRETSKTLYDLSWKDKVDGDEDSLIMASGFSCRCQVKRYSDRAASHPLGSVK